MKKLLFIAFAVISFAASAQSTKITNGYYKPSTGTYVNPYISTKSNSTNRDNFSTTGNANPYTGTSGTRAQDYTPAASNYGSGKTIQTGSRGGQYYVNPSGNKTYVPKRY